jgi:hypothetical protein
MFGDSQVKQQQEKLYATSNVNANTQQAQAVGKSPARDICSDGPAACSLREQLKSRTYDLQNRHAHVHRALDILTRHPEFEEFLELQQLINSGVQY